MIFKRRIKEYCDNCGIKLHYLSFWFNNDYEEFKDGAFCSVCADKKQALALEMMEFENEKE